MINEYLKKIPMFANLPEDDLESLCEMVVEEKIPAGKMLFIEGEVGDKAYVIKEGQIEILKSSGGRTIMLAVRHAGDVIGEMSLLEASPRFASGRARTDSLMLAIDHGHLENLLNTSPSAARVMLSTVTNRLRSTELVLQQSEKMAQLGTLTAGIAHELNNPSSAVRRGSEHLRTAIEKNTRTSQELYSLSLSDEQEQIVDELEQVAKQRAIKPIDLDSLDRSDKEEEIEGWLDSCGIDNAWELAPGLVNLSLGTSQQESMVQYFPGPHLEVLIQWLNTIYEIFSLLEESHQGAERIGEIVKSLKSYAYLDQAPVQEVDIHEGLDNTLVMMRSKIGSDIQIRRQYAENLPHIQAYASELNQVWTNLIDNSIDAMDGLGEIILRTRQDGDCVVIEFEDNGPGIPPEIQEKVFSPFFTTKAIGKGTGLGMNISSNIIRKHNGDIKILSRPGRTVFEIWISINFEVQKDVAIPAGPGISISDEGLLEILEEVKEVAVVGISKRENTTSYSVSAYLQRNGYHITPINPNYEEILGKQTYPDLLSLPKPVDLVLIFRRSEVVPDIVDQAIQIGAKGVWMQEGIINTEAAMAAHDAGIKVVMNMCMRRTHQRLLKR